MDWIQVLTITASTIGCCLFFRRETNDHREQLAEQGRDSDKETKDFHSRMCVLEERYIQMMRNQEEIRNLMLQKAMDKK